MNGLMGFADSFHFLRPQWLLLLLPYVLITALQWRRNDLSSQWRPVIAAHLLPEMIVRGSYRSPFSPATVSAFLSLLLTIALAGPSWQRGETPFAEDKAALVIAVDLSASMDSTDLQPTRLQRARDKILRLVEDRGDAYTGLIAYAGSAHTVLPLANDADVLLHYLDALSVGMLPREGKAPELTLALAEEILAARGVSGTLLLVSDGANNASTSAFEHLRDDPALQLLVWGTGLPQEALDRERERGLTREVQPLQEDQLRALADAAGGFYQRLTQDDSDLRVLRRRIEQHFLASEDSSRPWLDEGFWLVPVIMLLFLLWFRRGWVLKW